VSEIEWYLDELSGQLAGTGAAGRRALMEAGYHLRAVAADAMTRGLPQDQAGHEAVSRFGPPALVASKLRSAGRLNPAVSAAWLLAGLAPAGSARLTCWRPGGIPGRHRTATLPWPMAATPPACS
jgi:hypothetical protein